ncbi:hypothetical protein JAAARDRAFT_708980 [Jaapia argillacea MUCL 33604]|uniref:Uncharacterized protein n=1 Tax=Jaapia argillacea MUCL 33604 TaxID=933084 RepID=A0A067Q1F6_9AGAM|nr:hypothetical protein JAAARDRAFT_708980 [Jaapia argillacea MUCL 33604]
MATLAFASLSESCSIALAVLASPPPPPPPPFPPTATLHTDLLALLSHISHSTTKLALLLNPSSPSPSASLPVLSDLSNYLNSLTSCALSFNPTFHGATLRAEVVARVNEVVGSVRALIQTYLNIAQRDSRIPGTVRSEDGQEEYLRRTGTVYALVDAAKEPSPKGLSRSNAEAVKRKWDEDRDTVQDGLKEVAEMITDTGEDDDDEDGWDELGLGSNEKPSPEELERTKKIHTLLKLTTLLHTRTSTLLSSPPPSLPLDSLPPLSTSYLTSSDDLISTLYIPQHPPSISTAVQELVSRVRELESVLFPPLEEVRRLVDGVAALSVDESGKGKEKEAKERKWFELCFKQIYKVSDGLHEELLGGDTPPTS